MQDEEENHLFSSLLRLMIKEQAQWKKWLSLHRKIRKADETKLEAAGLHSEHAEEVARHLTFADASGIHSHGRFVWIIMRNGLQRRITIDPELSFEKLDRPLPFSWR